MSSMKPCPFCGSNNIGTDIYTRDGRSVMCFECRASVTRFNPDANSKAIEAWNKRASPEESDIRNSTLEEAAKVAWEYECSLADYGGSVDAKHFYEGGVEDASVGISAAILDLKAEGESR